jgi:ribosome-binding protein aMBF1 (putative translation factor)
MECFRCGVLGDKALLFDVISGTGIVKICKRCSSEERLPIIRKQDESQVKELERRQSFSRLISNNVESKKEIEKRELNKTETTLRDIINKKYKEKVPEEKKSRDDLVDNFHWIIMRSRRARKLTQQQLAEEILEPEAAIKLAEQGVLPENDFKLLIKLENALKVNLFKKRPSEEKPKFQIAIEPEKELPLDKDSSEFLTIADLKRMKEERESEIFGEKRDNEEETL